MRIGMHSKAASGEDRALLRNSLAVALIFPIKGAVVGQCKSSIDLIVG